MNIINGDIQDKMGCRDGRFIESRNLPENAKRRYRTTGISRIFLSASAFDFQLKPTKRRTNYETMVKD